MKRGLLHMHDEEDYMCVKLLLEHKCLLDKVDELENKVMRNYAILVATRAVPIWENMPPDWEHMNKAVVARVLSDKVNQPCQCGKKTMHKVDDTNYAIDTNDALTPCNVTREIEQRIITTVMRMLESEEYRADMIYLADCEKDKDKEKTEKTKTKTKTTTVSLLTNKGALKRLKHKLETCAHKIIRKHMCRAIWKRFLDQDLDILESMLSDGNSYHAMQFQYVPLAWEVFKVTRQSMECVDNTHTCRHCFRDIQKKMLRKKKNKNKKAIIIPCPECRRVYFCNKACRADNAGNIVTGHKAIECEMLLYAKKLKIKN